ncbi:MAG: hypothetical protein HQ553_11095 [Chloroflexi bacterium]|nr:hypothetical protein [Chloroflexota bacterium]
MGKKTYQSGGRYAKQGTQPKKRRPRKPTTPMNASAASPQADTTEGTLMVASQPARPRTKRADHTTGSSSYSYVISDLKRTGIFAAVAFAILIILAAVL